MKASHLSIRATLLAIIGVLNIMIAVLVGAGLARSWTHLRQAQDINYGSVTINFLYSANKSLSVERAAALSVMYASSGISQSLQTDLIRSRDEAREMLASALSRLNSGDDPAVAEATAKVRQKLEALENLRAELDAALNRPMAKRDLQISDRTFKASTGLIMEIQTLILAYTRSLKGVNGEIARQMMFKYFVWDLAEYAGEEYAVIGKMIVENKRPTPEQQERLMSLRGHIEYGWEIIRRFAVGDDLAEELLPYMEEAETHYFLTFDQIKDFFYISPISANAPYPISIEIWLGLASQAVDSLLSLQDTVLRETQIHVDRMEQAAERGIAGSGAIFLFSFFLTLYCWRVIVRRVTRPVNTMVDTLYRATRGEPYEPPQIAHHHDEIGKLAEILEVFQENSRLMRQSNEELERYAYIASHDLKSPLRAIDNLSQWIEEDMGHSLSPESRKHMDTLRQRVRRMEKLLDDTLEYSRLSAGFLSLGSEVVNGRDLIEDVVALLELPKGFTVRIGEGFSDMELGRMPLQQVFHNLIGNAVRHHDRKTGTVTVDVQEAGDLYIFSVRDDGPGIPREYHSKIFEMFQTLQPRDRKEGSGMGLAFVKKILDTCGGEIEVESGIGRGAAFRFTWKKSFEEKRYDRRLRA